MVDNPWWPIRKTATLLYLEYGHTHARLFATNIEARPGPPVEIRLDLEKNLRTRFTGPGTCTNATELASGEIKRLKRLDLDDKFALNNLSALLRNAEDISPPWHLTLNLRGHHIFNATPELKEAGNHRTLIFKIEST